MDDAGHVEAIGAQGISRLPNSLLMDLRATMPSPTHTSSLPTFTSEEVLAEALASSLSNQRWIVRTLHPYLTLSCA